MHDTPDAVKDGSDPPDDGAGALFRAITNGRTGPHVVELRALKIPRRYGKPATEAGFFDLAASADVAALEKVVADYTARSPADQPRGVYLTPNPVSPALRARAAGRVTAETVSAGDENVEVRRFLYLDVDPTRPSGISATDEEKAAARAVFDAVLADMATRGWAEPVTLDSGNGYQGWFPIDLPADDGGLVERCLKALAARHDTPAAHVDTSLYNPSRIVKLPGTWARKGDDLPDRPHRPSRVLSLPVAPATTPRELVEALAAECPGDRANPKPSVPGAKPPGNGSAHKLRVAEYLTARGIGFRVKGKDTKHGTGYVLGECPFDATHKDPDSVVMQDADGKTSFRCLHNSCAGRGWREFKAKVGEPDRDHYDPPVPVPPKLNFDGAVRNGVADAARPGECRALGVGRKDATPAAVASVAAYSPFPTAALPDGLREYVGALAAAVDCDPAFVALPALAVAGAALGASAVVSPKRNYREPPVVFACVVGDSGTGKSPGQRPTADVVWAVNRDLKAKFAADLVAYEKSHAAWEGGENPDPAAEPRKPARQFFGVSDITIERLVEVLGDSPRGVVVVRDELAGWFDSFRKYKGKSGGSDAPAWLSVFDGGAVSYHRKTGTPRDVEVERALASVVGGTQPDVLKQILSDPSYIASGLAARLALAWPPKHCPRWTDAELDQGTEAAFRGVIDRLRAVPFDPRSGPAVVRLDHAALTRFKNLSNEFAAAAEDIDSGPMASVLPKAVRYALRLALVHHAATEAAAGCDPVRGCISDDSMRAGEKLARWLAAEADRVYAMVAERPEDRAARLLLEWVRRKGCRVTPRQLQRSNDRRYPTAALAEAALDGLVNAGLGRWEVVAPDRGGHTQRTYVAPDARHSPTYPPPDDCPPPDDRPTLDADTPSVTQENKAVSRERRRVSGVGQHEKEPDGTGKAPEPSVGQNGRVSAGAGGMVTDL